MANGRIPITREGYDRKKIELDRLKNVEMIEIAKRIAIARDLGDLSENAEYHAAREEQGLLEDRINFLEDHLSRAEVIDVSHLAGSKILFGATVTLLDEVLLLVTFTV